MQCVCRLAYKIMKDVKTESRYLMYIVDVIYEGGYECRVFKIKNNSYV